MGESIPIYGPEALKKQGNLCRGGEQKVTRGAMGLEYYPEVVSLFSKMNWFIKHDQMCLRKVNLELFGGK